MQMRYLVFVCLFIGVIHADDTILRGDAALVAMNHVPVVRIMKIWKVDREEWIRRFRSGEIDAAECENGLQESWTNALNEAIRDELFYQEANHMFEQLIQKETNHIYAAQSSRNSQRSRGAIERDVRERFNRIKNEMMRKAQHSVVLAAGGMVKFEAMLKRQNTTFADWKTGIERQIMVQIYLSESVSSTKGLEPRPADVVKYYKDHPEKFLIPGNVLFRHILFDADTHGGEEGAVEAAGMVYHKIVDNRITFEEAAKQYSEDVVSKDRGGLESNVSIEDEREAWLGDVRDAVKKLSVNELSPVLISVRGAHLAILLEKGEDKPIPFDEAQRLIRDEMSAEAWKKKTEEHSNELKRKTRIDILMPTYPPEWGIKRITDLPTQYIRSENMR